MKRKIPFAVHLTSGWLLLHLLLISLDAPLKITTIVFSISPFLLAWMVITVLRSKSNVRELATEEEWGYADKNKDELGTF